MKTSITVTIRTVRGDGQPDIVDTFTREMQQCFQTCGGDVDHGQGCGAMYLDLNFEKCPACGSQLVCVEPAKEPA